MHAQDFLPAARPFQQDTRRHVQIHDCGLGVSRPAAFRGIDAVLDHDKADAAQFEAGLFPHLAAQGVLGRLAALDLAARDASCCSESFRTAE
jgi:hypothetical protein